MLEMHESEDAESAAVLQAALALIEDAYPSAGHHSRPRCASAARRDELQRLRAQVAELERVLTRLRGPRWFGPLDGSSIEALWAEIALNQQRLRCETIGENARLKEYARAQLALAEQLRRAAELGAVVGAPLLSLRAPELVRGSAVSVMLAGRLDAIETRASRGWIGLQPSVGTEFRSRDAQLSAAGDALVVQYCYGGYVPFKLSLVASELWDFMLHTTFGADATFTVDTHSKNEASSNLTLQINVADAPRLEIQGPSALRRVFTSDGSVVFAGASAASGSVAAGNLLEGFQIHEASWLRVGRAPTVPASGLVYIESFCHLDIKPTDDRVASETQLTRVRSALLRMSEVLGPSNLQKLENRLLDATRGLQNISLRGAMRSR